MLNTLEEATMAAEHQNWSLLNQCLCQMVEAENLATAEAEVNRQLALNYALEILEAGDFQERWDVAKLFPKLGMMAIAPLINILEDEDAEEELRWFVARILAHFNCPEVISALIAILKSSESEELSAIAAETLANLGQNAIAALTELLAAAETRFLAVRSLCAIRRSEIITPLLSVVNDQQVAVRAAAIEALSSFADSRIPPILLQALKDLAAPVRREAIIGLSLRNDLQNELDLVSEIIPLLWDLNLDVCVAAANALGRLGTDAAADALLKVVISPHTPTSLQLQCVRSLGWIGTPKALNYLAQALSVESVVIYQEIIMVLGRVEQANLAANATEILINALKSSHPAIADPNIRKTLAVSLGELGNLLGIDALNQLLTDVDLGVKLHAVAALKKLGVSAHLGEDGEVISE